MDWENCVINSKRLEQAIERQEVGAIEFALLLKAGDSIESVASLLASGHGCSLKEHMTKLVQYLISNRIVVEKTSVSKTK